MSQDSFTPEEAREVICPKQFFDPSRHGTCVGPRCMAWRWSQTKQTREYLKQVVEYSKANPEVKLHEAMKEVLVQNDGRLERTEGYCGMAGYPHGSPKP